MCNLRADLGHFNNEYIDKRGYSHRIKKGDGKDMNKNINYLQTGKIIRIGDKVRIIKYKKENLIGKEGLVKQCASTGKIRVTVEKWNYWVNFDEIELVKSSYIFDQEPLYQDIQIIDPIQKFVRKPKYKVGQELKNNETGSHVGCVSSILIEYDIKNDVKDIYYKFFHQEGLVNENKLTDDFTVWRKYVKKHIEVSAHQTMFRKLLDTHNGQVWAEQGDYIVKDIEGKEYPCKKEIFEKTYDKVEDIIKKEQQEIKTENNNEYNKVKEAEQVLKNKYEELDFDKEAKNNNMIDIISAINNKDNIGKKEIFNYKYNIGDKVILIKTMNKVKGEIVSRKFWNNMLQYGVMVDNIIRTVIENDLELRVGIEENKDSFKYKIGDTILLDDKIEANIVDRKIHAMPDKKEINQYQIKNCWDELKWVNEDELNISDKINKMAREDELFKFMLKNTVFYKDHGITLKVQIVDRKITKEYILSKVIDIYEYRVVNDNIDKWVKEEDLIENIVLPEIKKD
jgi:hypothetical protein